MGILWMTGWKKRRRIQRRAQRQTRPEQGAARRRPRSLSQALTRAPAERGTPETRRRRVVPAGREARSGGARPEPRSHWLRRHRPDKALQSSSRRAAVARALPDPGPPAPQHPQPAPGAPPPCSVLLLPRSCGLSGTPATARSVRAQGSRTGGLTAAQPPAGGQGVFPES